jgi:rod shape-determining protein MreB
VRLFIENIKNTIEATPPELVADIYERGIVLSGGGALLRGLDKAIQEEVRIPVHIIDDPLTAVVRGTGLILEDIDSVKELFVLSTQEDTYLK